jgi:hypothetical protein
MNGGTRRVDNIVRCCLMCNSIKGARLYEWFVPFFQRFLELHGEEYRRANRDDWDHWFVRMSRAALSGRTIAQPV